MSQPAITSATPTGLVRRAFSWWLAQVRHALPPTIFFLVGFNLFLWTKRLILLEHGIVDSVVPRAELKATVGQLLRHMSGKPASAGWTTS